ncbi:hypothetical protein Tsubulata_034904 [Turnera subulata]|uniref:Defensin-like protein n=1 Tax=Turnera subulata TaxID=218843 RepID=A0A9Q0FXL9_9ROSI|nr:hypothetical protein Tsubulata_034904 [Turnera subulata]
MKKAKIMPLILILVLMACIGEIRQINAFDHLCCKDHSAVGKCIPGFDDLPELSAKCYRFCIDGCRNGKGGYWTRQINADGLCCKDHSAVGECIPGVDDSPETPGKCFSFCLDGCLNGKGGVCKPVGKGHICHCCCDYERCH